MQWDLDLYKKRRLGHRHAQREGHVTTRVHGKERGLGRNNPAYTVVSDF